MPEKSKEAFKIWLKAFFWALCREQKKGLNRVTGKGKKRQKSQGLETSYKLIFKAKACVYNTLKGNFDAATRLESSGSQTCPFFAIALCKKGALRSKTKHFSDIWSIWCRFIVFYNSGKVNKVEILFCKMSQMVAIAKLPSWHLAFFRFAWRSEKSGN